MTPAREQTGRATNHRLELAARRLRGWDIPGNSFLGTVSFEQWSAPTVHRQKRFQKNDEVDAE
jgi:hypothetical protein